MVTMSLVQQQSQDNIYISYPLINIINAYALLNRDETVHRMSIKLYIKIYAQGYIGLSGLKYLLIHMDEKSDSVRTVNS